MNSQNRIEILAPVGGAEQLKAAVFCGADAVYFGMKDFNARRNADNFGELELEDAVRFCHERGVRVHITLNTLVTDAELSRMREAADTACRAGVDALIIQDLAVAEYVRSSWPDMEMHASTQMAAHNAEGVRQLTRMGFDRVVLARELSLFEIRSIIDETGVPCEVFVHGAHCMSVSGNCYLSAMIGTRSGNRGMCAQPCRLNWEKDGREYVLSLKDLSYISHMKELQEAGICSLKIEGRMKRAEYVAAAVTACVDARAGLGPDLESLRAVFSRSGFTDGYLTGKRNVQMFGIRTKEDVTAARDVLGNLAAMYRAERPRIDLSMDFSACRGKPAELVLSDGAHTAAVSGDVPEEAKTQPLTEESAGRNLLKTGGTPYRITEAVYRIDDGVAMAPGQLNRMRREALQAVSGMRCVPRKMKKTDAGAVNPGAYVPPETKKLRLRFASAEQIPDRVSADEIVLPLEVIRKDPELLRRFGSKLIAEIPALLWPGEGERIRSQLAEMEKEGLRHVLGANICAPEIVSGTGLILHGGPELNVLNAVSLREYGRIGFADLTVSFELSFRRAALLGSEVPRGVIVYGYLPLMKFRNCPGRNASGCGVCDGNTFLTDRTGERFPLLCRGKRYSELLNCVPVCAWDKRMPPADFAELYFSVETKETCAAVLERYLRREPPDFRRTGGLYFRELQ